MAVGKSLGANAISIIGCVMVCILVGVWFVVFTYMIVAVVNKDILWPQKQEDRDEGGWKEEQDEQRESDDTPSALEAGSNSNGPRSRTSR